MKMCALLLTAIGLMGCAEKPVIAAIDTLCDSTTRYHATDAQVAAFKADQSTWESLVNWLASFNKVRDGACLKPVAG